MGVGRKSFLVEIVMIMTLLTFFGASIYTLIYAGSGSQQRIIREKELQSDARTAISFLNIAIRQNDQSGCVEVVKNPETGENSILIKYRQGDESDHFDRWIFSRDGCIYEFIGSPEKEPLMEYSFEVLKIAGRISIDFSEEHNCITNTVYYTDADTGSISQTIYLRSAVMGAL